MLMSRGLSAKRLDVCIRSRPLPCVFYTATLVGALLTIGNLSSRKPSSFGLSSTQSQLTTPASIDSDPRNSLAGNHATVLSMVDSLQTASNSRSTSRQTDLAVVKLIKQTHVGHLSGTVHTTPKLTNKTNKKVHSSIGISSNKISAPVGGINLIEYFNLSSKLPPPENVNHYFDCTAGIALNPREFSAVKDWNSVSVQMQPYVTKNSGYMGCRLTDADMRNLNRTSTVAESVNRYVSFTSGFLDGRGMGNQLFNLASMVYVAQLTGRKPAILPFRDRIELDDVFALGLGEPSDVIERQCPNLCPAMMFIERCSLAYDDRVERLVTDYGRSIENASIFLSGYFQSWRYVHPVDRPLRKNYLVFQPEVAKSAERFLSDNAPVSRQVITMTNRDDMTRFVRVGVHVRRGDTTTDAKIAYGYTTPNETYYMRALLYFVERHDRVQFIVCGNDVLWMRKVFTHLVAQIASVFSSSTVDLIFSEYHPAAMDLAILARCDHVIMSTGTFGWWGAWLAGGTTIYYANWPKPRSPLSTKFRREDFFPPSWIGMTDAIGR